MTARNDHTGDLIASKPNSDAYRDNMQRIIDAKRRRESEEADRALGEYLSDDDIPLKGGGQVPPGEPTDETPGWAAE